MIHKQYLNLCLFSWIKTWNSYRFRRYLPIIYLYIIYLLSCNCLHSVTEQNVQTVLKRKNFAGLSQIVTDFKKHIGWKKEIQEKCFQEIWKCSTPGIEWSSYQWSQLPLGTKTNHFQEHTQRSQRFCCQRKHSMPR